MRTDTFLYDFFVHKPAELARLLRLDPSLPWAFDSVAVKRVERAIDGRLFCAERSEGPVFVELQGYRDPLFYWRLYNEITAYWMSRPVNELEGKSFQVFVLFLENGHDPKNSPLSPLLPHSLVTMTLKQALAELPEPGLLLVLEPLVLKDLAALEARLPHYRTLIEQLSGTQDERTLIQGLLVQAIITRFPDLTQLEVKKMLNLIPIRETRFYKDVREEFREEFREVFREEGWKQGREEGRQEGREEGRQEGREEGRQEGILLGEQKGRKEGKKEGQLATLRKQLLKLWTLRFGPPVDWVTWRINHCKSLSLLETLFEQITLAPSAEEAQTHVKSALGNGT